MTTKAELEAELEKLRARNAQLEAKADPGADANDKPDGPQPIKTTEEIRNMLAEHGIDLSKAEAIGEEAIAEFGRLQKDYPITALLIAFTLGYTFGRARG